MKKTFTIEWEDSMGPKWVTPDVLRNCLARVTAVEITPMIDRLYIGCKVRMMDMLWSVMHINRKPNAEDSVFVFDCLGIQATASMPLRTVQFLVGKGLLETV